MMVLALQHVYSGREYHMIFCLSQDFSLSLKVLLGHVSEVTSMVRFPGTQQTLPSNKCKCSFKFPQFLLLKYSFKYQFYYFICTSLETTITCMLDSVCLSSMSNLCSFIYFSYLVFLHLAMTMPQLHIFSLTILL